MSAFLPGFGRSNLATLLVYLVLGIGIGMAVNGLNMVLQRKFPKAYRSPYAAVPLQLLPVILVLVSLQFVVPSFTRNMTTTLPGVFFVSFFFGTQFSVMMHLVNMAMSIPFLK